MRIDRNNLCLIIPDTIADILISDYTDGGEFLDATLDEMVHYGGSFTKTLAELTRRADIVNKRKAIATWSVEFFDYFKQVALSKGLVKGVKAKEVS